MWPGLYELGTDIAHQTHRQGLKITAQCHRFACQSSPISASMRQHSRRPSHRTEPPGQQASAEQIAVKRHGHWMMSHHHQLHCAERTGDLQSCDAHVHLAFLPVPAPMIVTQRKPRHSGEQAGDGHERGSEPGHQALRQHRRTARPKTSTSSQSHCRRNNVSQA